MASPWAPVGRAHACIILRTTTLTPFCLGKLMQVNLLRGTRDADPGQRISDLRLQTGKPVGRIGDLDRSARINWQSRTVVLIIA